MAISLIIFLLGLALLICGARLLVFGASKLALAYKLPPLFVGLTIVAFGTSAPEIAVNAVASLRGEPGLVIGNVVGSNIFNILLVLGLAATITPIVVKRKLIRLDVPIMIGVTLVVWAIAYTHTISTLAGLFLLLGIIAYTTLSFFLGRNEAELPKEERAHPLWLLIGATLLGIILLALSAHGMVRSAEYIAKSLGVSDLIIGLTLLAVGTSLPELAASLVAACKKEKDIAVGNIIGSNLFNLLAVLGVSALLSPEPLSVPQSAITFDFPILVAVSIACLPIFWTGHLIARWEGILFLFYYFLYLVTLTLRSFTNALLLFLIPLTLITLTTLLARTFRSQKKD